MKTMNPTTETGISRVDLNDAAQSSLEGLARDGLEQLGVEHLTDYQAAIAAGVQNGWHYHFPVLLARQRPGRRDILIGRDGASICVFQLTHAEPGAHLDLLLAPAPMDPGVLQRALERANDFNRGHDARVFWLDEKDADAVARAGLKVSERKRQFVFAPAQYRDLTGRAFYTVRRQIQRVTRNVDVEVRDFQLSDRADCRDLLKRWQRQHRAKHGTQGGVGTARSVLEIAGRLPERVLRGQVLRIDGNLAGFAFGGEIRPGLACSLERKCDAAVPGLSYFQFQTFLASFSDAEFVNDGSDAGRAGLRQLKESFRPVSIHTEYRALQR